MTYTFSLPDWPNAIFQMEHSIWTGKTLLFKDNHTVEQLTEKGKPFLIKKTDGEAVMAYPKMALPDLIPILEIEGIKHQVAPKLQWYEYAIGGLPLLLIFMGGAIGGGLGAAASVINYNLFRGTESNTIKYIKVIGVIIACYALYWFIAALSYHLSH